MPFDLHQRLSEFSYGYGVTREVEKSLRLVGIRTVPFLPSLVHEATIGCDVHFDRPGAALLIQFKLGHELKQFRRSDTTKPAPRLNRPFWRFEVDTAAEDGQYDILLKAEHAGAEVYYAAPRFADWDRYADAFQRNEILNNSLLIAPSEIDTKLVSSEEPDGFHKIVYDEDHVYVCSEAKQVKELSVDDIASRLEATIRERDQPIRYALKDVFESFGRRRDIRRAPVEEQTEPDGISIKQAILDTAGRSPAQIARERERRLDSFRERAKTEDDAMFAAVGFETWAAGTQLIAVTAS